MTRTVFTLACEKCARGWQSPVPQGVCGRCGATVTARAQYELVDLR